MIEIYDKIKDFKWDENNYFILCEKNNLKVNIIDGSLDIEVRNSENKYIGFHLLEKNDIIKIKYEYSDNEFLYPKIIFQNIKYNFIDDSSEEEYI
tara:strand:+ start:768 stop:1052 length:285 start_codon:yes stop_codon:yes gene_type:complete